VLTPRLTEIVLNAERDVFPDEGGQCGCYKGFWHRSSRFWFVFNIVKSIFGVDGDAVDFFQRQKFSMEV
jgi:hypothetical protein